ncbi:MAG TPA: ATP-binding protein [Rhodothermales bacterium]|nr:ATP-binding protein [Rhodothermales bacterium]
MHKEFPSTPQAVAGSVHFAEGAARRDGLPEELIDRLALAVGEAAGNAVEHGNVFDASLPVRVSYDGGAEGCWVRIGDSGAGMNAARLGSAALPDDPLSTSGRGLFLIMEVADEVRMEEDGRTIAMWFARRPEA